MTDLEKRAEVFRGKWKQGDVIFKSHLQAKSKMFDIDDLIAEIKWARENPPFSDTPDGDYAWKLLADHLLDCLGEKNGN